MMNDYLIKNAFWSKAKQFFSLGSRVAGKASGAASGAGGSRVKSLVPPSALRPPSIVNPSQSTSVRLGTSHMASSRPGTQGFMTRRMTNDELNTINNKGALKFNSDQFVADRTGVPTNMVSQMNRETNQAREAFNAPMQGIPEEFTLSTSRRNIPWTVNTPGSHTKFTDDNTMRIRPTAWASDQASMERTLYGLHRNGYLNNSELTSTLNAPYSQQRQFVDNLNDVHFGSTGVMQTASHEWQHLATKAKPGMYAEYNNVPTNVFREGSYLSHPDEFRRASHQAKENASALFYGTTGRLPGHDLEGNLRKEWIESDAGDALGLYFKNKNAVGLPSYEDGRPFRSLQQGGEQAWTDWFLRNGAKNWQTAAVPITMGAGLASGQFNNQ